MSRLAILLLPLALLAEAALALPSQPPPAPALAPASAAASAPAVPVALRQVTGPLELPRHLPINRNKRSMPFHIIKDCLTVTSDEGEFFHKASGTEGAVCGVYLLTDPDRTVELHFDHLDIPCEKGGLVSFVDGWEMNGQLFPSPSEHPKPLSARAREVCGTRRLRETLRSSQNAALVQFRVPEAGRGFSFTVRYPRNSTPCNILLEGTSDVYTLRNYGRAANCTLATLFPASLKVLQLSVGMASTRHNLEVESGTIHKCSEKSDYVELGGAEGLDTSLLTVADSLCGTDSKQGSSEEAILCGVSAVRLVSGGEFDNSVTVAVREMREEDIDTASLICGV